MKFIVALSVALCASSAIAASMPCERWEYARLKDASRQELTKAICSANRAAELNRRLGELADQAFSDELRMGTVRGAKAAEKKVSDLGDARLSCIQAADDAQQMLAKKFKVAKAPTCP